MSRLGLTFKDLEDFVAGRSCKWTESKDGAWHTECGETHRFQWGSPIQNFRNHCMYCGQFLWEERYKAGAGSEELQKEGDTV